MRVALAMIADTATVREGLLHALGLGINNVGRESFPSPFNAVIVIALERRPEDSGVVEVPVRAEIRAKDSPDGEPIFEMGGTISFDNPTVDRSFYIPLVIESQGATIPSPGGYQVTITAGDLPAIEFPFDAIELPGESQ